MGLGPQVAEILIREHMHKRLPRRIVTIGRTFTAMTHADTLAVFARCGCEPEPTRIVFDDYTMESRQRVSGKPFVSDTTFFGMMGVQDVVALDISDYEGAGVIADLNQPLPEHLKGTAEFIYGPSTLDNIFDPAQYIRNVSALLSSQGRLVEQNVWSNRYRPYVLVSPPWLFDFFVVNRFARCRLFIIEHSNGSHLYELRASYNPEQRASWGLIDNFEIDQNLLVVHVVIAEKDEESRSDLSPVQDSYRSQRQVDEYNANLRRILENQHPKIVLKHPGREPLGMAGCGPGHNYGWLGTFD